MKKILVMILVCIMIGSWIYVYSSRHDIDYLSETHIGGAILKEPGRQYSEDIYSVRKEPVEGYGDFNRTVTVYGLTLIVHKDIPDDFVLKITETMKSMFPRDENMDSELQEQVLQNMYRYKAALPVVKNESDVESVQKELMSNYSVCDIIMEVDENQVNEIIEHLLHAVSDVGLHYTFTNEWGVSKETAVFNLMQDAISKGYYNIKEYKGYPEEILNRVLIQEYVYWSITSIWNLQESFDLSGSEWSLTSSMKVNEFQPELLKLYELTLKNIIKVPSSETLIY